MSWQPEWPFNPLPLLSPELSQTETRAVLKAGIWTVKIIPGMASVNSDFDDINLHSQVTGIVME